MSRESRDRGPGFQLTDALRSPSPIMAPVVTNILWDYKREVKAAYVISADRLPHAMDCLNGADL